MPIISSKLQRSLAFPVISDSASTHAASAVVSPDSRRWCALAVASLVIAGLLSLSVVIGRLPFMAGIINDPLFFKRCLVVHVDLSLVVWFYAFIASLLSMRFSTDSGFLGRLTFGISITGVIGMLAGAVMRGAQPILSNYIPMIDHPLFTTGLVLFFMGIVGFYLAALARDTGVADGPIPREAMIGLQAAALAVALAVVTWISAQAGLPGGLDTATYYEFTIWGAGHALQVANTCAMLAVWLWVLNRATGAPLVSTRTAHVLFGLMITPHFILPLLTLRGTLDSLYHNGATQLMRWGIFPIAMAFLVLGIRHLWIHRTTKKDSAARALVAGFIASAGLTLLGVILGACIRSSTTLVPAHYHASLGGVTVAFMTAAFLIAATIKSETGLPQKVWKSVRRQLAVFGIGQTIFALGFAIGGVYGLSRKAYASEQHVRSLGEHVGLITMGLGGLVAVVGGLWFLFLIIREIRGWRRSGSLAGCMEKNN